jgi:ABC-2 type transport system permease protein
MNLKSVAIYNSDFIFGIVSIVIKLISKLLLILIIYSFIDNIAGWGLNQLLFLYSFSTTSYAVWHCFFINTITIPTYIRNGTLDVLLLRPIGSVFQIMMDGFDEDGWGELFFGIVLSIVAIVRLKIFSPFLLLLPLLWCFGSLIFAGISLILASFAFFTKGYSDFTDITMELQDFGKYPTNIYGKYLSIFLTFLMPLGFTAFYPSLFYIESSMNHMLLVFATPVVCILFFGLSCLFWKFSLRFYSSAGN